jgi:hypothetical protein
MSAKDKDGCMVIVDSDRIEMDMIQTTTSVCNIETDAL